MFKPITFYQYHVRFSRKAVAYLEKGITVDWARRNKEELQLLFGGVKSKICDHCTQSDHESHFCPSQINVLGVSAVKKIEPYKESTKYDPRLTDQAVLKRHILVKFVIPKFVISSIFIFVRSVNHLTMGSPNVSLRNQKLQLPHPIQSLRKVNKRARHDWICSIPDLPPPVNVDNLQMELRGHPDPAFVQYLCQGLREGFDTLIPDILLPNKECKNLLSAQQNASDVQELIVQECQKGYLYGPFHQPPFDNNKVSPLGLAMGK